GLLEALGDVRAAAGRDVLWVVMESTAARYLRPFGAAEDPTPNLTALAAGSIAFESIYAAYPESIKGLFSLLCSQSPAAHTTAARYTQDRLPCPAIAQRFAAAGYKTAMFHSGWFVYLGMDGVIRDRGFAVKKDAGAIGGTYATSFGVDEASTVKQVLGYFDGLRPSERAFVMYLPIAGHHPYRSPGPATRPRPFGEQTELDCYRNDLYLGDAALGALIEGLRARGRLARTALVFSGDHGEAFRQHEGNFGHTLYLYDENLRVPLLIVLPGLTDQPGFALPRRVAQPGSVLDIAPTLLHLTGLPIPPKYQGRSLLRPAAADEVPRFLTDHAVYQVGLRQGRWKFIDEPESGRAQLFDLQADPDELQDVAAAQPQRVARYREHLRAFFTRQRLLVAGH
ncbi:MAG TPA: sulfatase-like hydrolase/transferase, partial [Pseudomonadota bacterium]|nr:sulfatase-like hydrolase/transferase [Pseudomonadota bacterium]